MEAETQTMRPANTGMHTHLADSLQAHFGFKEFRPGQVEAIQRLLAGQHTLVVMPTGAGKSLVYQLAALQLPGLTLVISPLIALMKDQVDSLERLSIAATFINSALPAGEQSRRLRNLARGSYRIVYVAPERLRSIPFLEALQGQKVGLLAVDEAHCISEWGHDFRPDYLNIAPARLPLGEPLTVALTATATPKVQEDILRSLGLPAASRIVTGFNRPNLCFEVRYTNGITDKLGALQELVAQQEQGAAIVYAGTRRDAEEVADFLRQAAKVKAEHYHAGLESEARTRIQEAFMSGKLPLVAATSAFGMGIDRADVRLVAHYSLPGSLEAYYQEAGRAGRDGSPARVALLYTPQDRALQEYFIENSTASPWEQRAIYETLRVPVGCDVWRTVAEFSRLTGLNEVKVKVGLAALERAGVVERLGDEGMRLLLRRGEWDEQKIAAGAAGLEEHQRYRTDQLERMVAYAEANTCRRKILLDHFGDPDAASAPRCCDNCRSRQQMSQAPAGDVAQMPQDQRVALIILDTVQRLKTSVGREKLAQVLKGSQAADIKRYHYDRIVYYGRLEAFRQSDIVGLIEQLVQLGYLKITGGQYPVVSLSAPGEAALRQKAAISLRMPGHYSQEELARKKAEKRAGGTVEYTAQLFAEGHRPEEIARQRGLTANTIYGHLAKLISAGAFPVEAVVPEKVRRQIEEVIEQVGGVDFLAPIKALLPEEIEYGVIRCVVEGRKRRTVMEEGGKTDEKSSDTVSDYLSKPHPRPLSGPWQCGWALGFHSRFEGAEWNRSGVGSLAYRLKYQGDLAALGPIMEQVQALLGEHPELGQVEAIVPVPASTPRPVDPVSALAAALGEGMGLPVWPALVKTRQTSPQKEIHTLAQKRANVAGAFGVQRPVKGKRLLVVDDLYDSGATLEEITRLLLRAGAAKVCVLTLTRTIHSDA